ncbi:hypothetical protein JK231_08975 [Pantoea sp. JGM49]|jgi:hypothetical protein|uniref:Type VI secretion system-associated protein n=1 Tax=Candidatus Pantoea communis TaxID=2608354 RepID=A0ABX0RKE1_9GAMM|nr:MULTISPECIES: hypothetical protein [Enterobacterales]KGT90568.1 hypothetical protein NH00_09335 [Enterobacter cancerogenus]MBS0880730.1 hypothetical protein [Pantoea sp. JGM49]MDI9276086.1 hypothetical protein [Pantoea sp. EABMAA-21]MXP52339.1 hypothetical protein [Pantoea sp. Seng]NIG18097.1 hypothetical protein [Pantoea communis]
MKVWLPGLATLLLALNAQADDYRVVYSPSLSLEVYIDNVASNSPNDWCKETLPLRIVSGKSTDSSILTSFLPRVGTLLANQCGTLDEIPWQMTNKDGSVLANGSAAKLQNWRPIVINDATASASASNAAPLDLSRPADSTPLQHFTLPAGCHFRTSWDENGDSLFIPDNPQQHCSTDGWLEGPSELTLMSGDKTRSLAVNFYQGYPIANLKLSGPALEVVAVNKQRMIVTRPDAEESWLVLPFDSQQHVWRFTGNLLIKMDKTAGQDSDTVKSRVETLRGVWSSQFMPQQKVTVLLIDTLHADLADPAIGAWRNIN